MTRGSKDVIDVPPTGSLPDTRFQKGVSGNPNGRPKGSKNKATLLREALDEKGVRIVQKNFHKVIKKLMELAEAGEMDAIKEVIKLATVSRVAPSDDADKGRGINITITNLTHPSEPARVGVTIDQAPEET